MSKYYKAENVNDEIVRVLEHTDCKDSYIDDVLRAIEKLPTIEVMEYPQVDGITPTVITPEVSEDCISREQIIEAHYEWCNQHQVETDVFYTWSLKLMKDAPSVVPSRTESEWIPCSERLPSERGDYLVTFPLCDGEPCVYMLSFNKGKFYETDDEWGDVQYVDVTAWMPLPEPWKGADDD